MASKTSGDEAMLEESQNSKEKKKITARRLFKKVFKNGKCIWKPALLIVLNGVYLLFGGAVFLFLEKKEHVAVHLSVSREIVEVLQVLNETRPGIINSSLNGVVMRETAENISVSDLEKWSEVLQTIYERRRTVDEYPKWTLFRAIFFCTTLLTTIGYGNIAPVTMSGRIFCVFYAFIGIPFNIMFLAVLGKLMADVINRICAEIIRLWTNYFHPNYEWKSLKGESEINAPVWLALIIFGGFLSFCAWIYSISENWDYWTACYFTFITFTTIGLGDIVPEKAETMVLIDTTLLYLGLAVLALTVNLIVANILHQVKKTRRKLPFVDRFEMSSVTSEISETKTDNDED